MYLQELLDMDIKEFGYVKSGILGVDAITGGYPIGELTVLCAPTSGGKSLISIDSALLAADKTDVIYISCENSLATDKKRIEASIEKYNLDVGNLSFEYYNMDNNNIGLDEIENIIAYTAGQIVFVDSIDFVNPDGTTGSELYQNYGKIARSLRLIARKYEVAIVTTAQINREGYDKGIQEMSVANIADSIKIARQAHDVWAISKDEYWAMKVVKHRAQLKVNKEIFAMSSPKYTTLNITQVFDTASIGAELNYKEAKILAEEK